MHRECWSVKRPLHAAKSCSRLGNLGGGAWQLGAGAPDSPMAASISTTFLPNLDPRPSTFTAVPSSARAAHGGRASVVRMLLVGAPSLHLEMARSLPMPAAATRLARLDRLCEGCSHRGLVLGSAPLDPLHKTLGQLTCPHQPSFKTPFFSRIGGPSKPIFGAL